MLRDVNPWRNPTTTNPRKWVPHYHLFELVKITKDRKEKLECFQSLETTKDKLWHRFSFARGASCEIQDKIPKQLQLSMWRMLFVQGRSLVQAGSSSLELSSRAVFHFLFHLPPLLGHESRILTPNTVWIWKSVCANRFSTFYAD